MKLFQYYYVFVCFFVLFECWKSSIHLATFDQEKHKHAKSTAPQLTRTHSHTRKLIFSALYRKIRQKRKAENQAEKTTQNEIIKYRQNLR